MAKETTKEDVLKGPPVKETAPKITAHKANKTPKESEFRSGKIVIPGSFEIDRKRFEKMFKGRVINLDKLWTDYQAWCKINK